MVSTSNSLHDQERTYSSLCLILITISTYIFTVIIILTMCCGKEKKEENEEQANEGKRTSRTVSGKSSVQDTRSAAPKSRKPLQKKLPAKLAKSRRKFPAPASSSAPKSSSSGGTGVNDEGPKVLPVDQIFPYANAPGKEEEHSRLIGISFASTMASSVLETSESKSKDKLGTRLPAPLKAPSPPVPSFLRKTMIRTTTKEDDEAQNPMLLEMDPATVYKNAPTAAKKGSSSQDVNKAVSTYNKIAPKKDDKNGDLKSGCKMDASASVMKDAYGSKKDDLMMVSFSAVPAAPLASDDKEKSKKKVDESQYTPPEAMRLAVQCLERTVSTVVAPDFSVDRALSAMLEEVKKCDSMSADDLISKISESRCCTSSKNSNESGPKFSLRKFWNEDFVPSLNDLGNRQNRSRSNLAYCGSDDEQQQQQKTGDDLGKSGAAAVDDSKFAKIAQYFSRFEDLDSDTFTRLIGSASLKNNIQNVADYFFDHFQEEWGNFFETIIPLRQMHTMLLISVFQLVSIHFLTSFLPAFSLYSSFFFAIYFTLKICHRYHSVNDIMAWNKLLIIFAAEIEQTRGSVNPRKGRLTPNRVYSISQESNDDARSTCRDKVLNCRPMYVSLMASLTLFIFSFSYRNSGQKKDISSNIFSLLAVSILCQTVTVSAVMANNEHRFLNRLWIFGHIWIIVPQLLCKLGFEDFAFWTYIRFSILDGGLVYDLNLFSLCFLLCVFLYLLYVASNFAAIDFYYTICPHLLGFLWSLLTLTLFKFTEFNSLQKIDIALTLSLVCLLILPKTGLFIILAILVSDHWHFVGLLKILFTTLIILLPMISTKFFTKFLRSLSVKFSRGEVSEPIPPIQNRQNTVATGIGTMSTIFYILIILILIFGFFYKVERSHFENNSIPKLNWTLFERYCLRFDDFSGESSCSYSNRPPLTRELFCRSVKGSIFTAIGRVKTIKIRQVDNFFEKIFEYLPDFLDEWLTCFYGHSLTDSGSGPENESLRPFVVRNCTLDHHNIYTFDLGIELLNKAENGLNDSFSVLNLAINLIADNTFKDVALALKENDQIHFVAKFDAYKIVVPAISIDFKLISVRRLDNGFEELILSHSSKESNQILLSKMKDKSLQAQTSTVLSKTTSAVMFTINFFLFPVGKLSIPQ